MNILVKGFFSWYAVIIYDLKFNDYFIYGWFIVNGFKVGVFQDW